MEDFHNGKLLTCSDIAEAREFLMLRETDPPIQMLMIDFRTETGLVEISDALEELQLADRPCVLTVGGESQAILELAEKTILASVRFPLDPDEVKIQMKLLFQAHSLRKREHELEREISKADRTRPEAFGDGPLAGFPGEAAFLRVIDREWKRSVRYERPLTVLLVSVLHFEDSPRAMQMAVTRDVALLIENGLHRPGDFVACLEPGSFGCVLPETDGAGMTHVGSRLLDSVAPQSVQLILGGATVTPLEYYRSVRPGPDRTPGTQNILLRARHALDQARASESNRAFRFPSDV